MKYVMTMLLVVTGFFAQAQSQTVTPAETKVAATVEKLRLAMISGHQQDLESVLSDDLVYVHSGGKTETKAEFVKAIVTKTSDFKSIDLEKQQVVVQGDLAIVRHFLNAETKDGGKKANIRLGIVLVFKKVNNEWLLSSRNAFHVTP